MNSVKGVGDALSLIWAPALEAMRLQNDLRVLSLEESIAAAERAGCAVHFADLPGNISGFAGLIGGKSIVVVNRAKPVEHQQYTLLHELGHVVLHLAPAHKSSELISAREDIADFQADMFAAAWIIGVTRDDEQKARDPETQSGSFRCDVWSAGHELWVLL